MVRRLCLCVLMASTLGCSDRKSETVGSDILGAGAIDIAVFGEVKRIPERAKDRREEAFEDFQTRSQIAAYLLNERLSDDYKTRIEAQELVNNLVLNRYLATRAEEEVTTSQVEDYYNANADQFGTREYEAAHIFFRLHPDADEAALKKAEEKAHAAHARLQSGEDFSALATELSDDVATREDGGKLPTLTSDNLTQSVDKHLSQLEPGEYTKPVRTDRGLQIFKLNDVKADPASLEEVADRIEYILKQEFQKKELDRLRVLARSAAS